MDDINGQQQGTGAAPDGAAPEPSIDELLDWDESKGTPPVEALPIARLKEYLTERDGRVIETVSAEMRERQRREAEEARAREESAATTKLDRDFAVDIETRLKSTDATVVAQAQADMEANRDRYRRGLAIAFHEESSERRMKAVGEYLAPLWDDLRKRGFAEFIDVTLKDRETLAKYQTADGTPNWVALAFDYADARGYERGKAEAAEAADQQRRINEGADGPPNLGGGAGGNSTGGLLDGIDRSKPGAYREVQARIAAQRQKQTAGR